ncbi:MAG: hypothetical protein DRP06_00490 [Candidatus Aenigmatarchaeota archaeon]|nr:MAG: hypothetical protein DRP06_00490 [Candidatus Aenigmarchaeota archaeon]
MELNNISRLYRPQEIDAEKWLKREKNDAEGFSKNRSCRMDKEGIIGESLFELTLDNQSSNISHRSVSVFTGDRVAKGLFHALCPELETFVTLINWMGSNTERNIKRLKYHQELIKFIEENKSDKICKIKGNYRIKKDDFAEVILYRGCLNIEDKLKKFYEWERVPFIKRSAETFAYFPSPIFMSSTPSNEEGVSEDKVSYFTLLFKIKNIQNNIVRLILYHCTNPYVKELDVIVYDPDLLDKLKQKTNEYFIGLFEDKIYKKNKSFNREFVLLKLSQELEGNDIAGHFIAQQLYYNYLKDLELYICTKKEFQKRCNLVFYHVKKSYGKDVNQHCGLFSQVYLDAYFVDIDDKIYYKPFIFKSLTNEEYIKFIAYLKQNRKEMDAAVERSDRIRLDLEYGKYKRYLEFLNNYNFYSKRTLIDIINEWVDVWKV